MSRKQRGSPITSPHTASIRKSPSTQTLMALLPENQGYQFIRQERKAKSESDLQQIRENRMKREMEREMIKEQNKEIQQPFRPLTRRQTMEFESPFQMKQRERPRYDPEFVDNFQSDLVDDKPDEDTNELPRPKPMRRSITLEGLDYSDKLGGGKKVRKRKTRKSTNKKKNKKTRSKKQKGGDLDSDLLIASQNGRLEGVRVLLERGADINKADNHGETPLLKASRNGHLNVVRVLLAGGADINKADNNGITPLWIASSLGRVNVVKLLLREGADINKASNRGWTPLSIASRMATYLDEGQEEVVKVLKNYVVMENIKEYKRPAPTLRSLAYSKLDTETTSKIN